MGYVVERHPAAVATKDGAWQVPGMPQTALIGGLPSRAIAGHWTAGEHGRQGALDTAAFLIARPDRNASYHEAWYWEPATRTFGVLLLVHHWRAAHSMNPKPVSQGGPYDPQPEVRRLLGDKVGDPNAASYAVAFAGMPDDLEAAMADREFLDGCERRVYELLEQETTITLERPIFIHAEAQPSTKRDWGVTLRPAIYARLYTPPPQEDDMPTPPLHYVPQLWRAKAGGAQLREQADTTAPVIATVPAGGIIFTVGEDPRAGLRWRLAVAGDPERLFFVLRDQVDPMPPTPRDPELHAGIAAVVAARMAGQPVPTGGIAEAEIERLTELARKAGFDAGFSEAKTKATSAVAAVQP